MHAQAKVLLQILENHGFEARIAGGAVRDLMMGNTPKDFDIATTAKPEKVIEIFQKDFTVIETGLQHGTVTVVFDHIPFEITTLRVDKETDGRHAVVEYTDDWKLDASRRDFTMNAMYMDRHGKIYDYFNGALHIGLNRITFVGNAEERIKEDYLRIMRYFRFSARYNSKFNEDEINAIQDNHEGLNKISRERIYSEVEKIIGYNNIDVLIRMNETQVSNVIFGKRLRFTERKSFDNWSITLHSMGVDSSWFVDFKAPKDVINEIKFYETFVPTELKFDTFKYGFERMKNYSKLHNLNWFFDFDVPNWPMSGHDFMDVSPSERGKEIIRKQKIWAANDFNMTREELMKV